MLDFHFEHLSLNVFGLSPVEFSGHSAQFSHISRFPLSLLAPVPGELSHPDLTPLPTHEGINYVARGALTAIAVDKGNIFRLLERAESTRMQRYF